MPRGPSGQYTLPIGTLAVTNTSISSAAYNNSVNDIAAELTNSLDVKGRSPMQANLPMGSNNIVSLLDPVNPQDGATKHYVDLVSLGFRNRVINGGMAIDQRNNGAAQMITAAAGASFTVDQWQLLCSVANVTGQQVANTGTADSPAQFAYQISAPSSGTGTFSFFQNINSINCFDFANTNTTFSFSASVSTATTITVFFNYANAKDNFSAITQFASVTFNLTPTLTRYAAKIAVPAAATTGLQIYCNAADLGTTATTWLIGNVQWIPGDFSSATGAAQEPPFERRPSRVELLLCQQYYANLPVNPQDFATKAYVDGNAWGFRNKLINGEMAIDQRNAGAAQTFTAGAALAYSIDRWYGYCTGANVTGQRVASGAMTPPAQYVYQFNGAASVTAIGFGQRIEAADCYDLAGQTATLSVNLANSLLTTVTWTAYYANTADTFGTLASPTRTQIATGAFTVNATATRYVAQIAIPAAATTGIEIVFTVGAQTSGSWLIGVIQLEAATYATSFERRKREVELALCQRYFEMSYDQGVVPGTASTDGLFGLAIAVTSAGTQGNNVRFASIKRIVPAITLYSPATGASGKMRDYQNAADVTGTAANIGYSGFTWNAVPSVSGVINLAGQFTANAEL